MNNNTDSNEMLNSKISIPTSSGVPFVSQNAIIENTDYEYLRFSLRITEDIIRNNLYNPKDMERVFNSHIEANRDRLEMVSNLFRIALIANSNKCYYRFFVEENVGTNQAITRRDQHKENA